MYSLRGVNENKDLYSLKGVNVNKGLCSLRCACIKNIILCLWGSVWFEF